MSKITAKENAEKENAAKVNAAKENAEKEDAAKVNTTKENATKRITTKQIVTTAALLAICIVSQFFKNISPFITGPIINACLIICVLSVGLVPALILSVITPVTSFMITGSPIMAAIPAIIPCVMIGNAVICICVSVFGGVIKGKSALPLSMAIGTVLKALFMGIIISLVLVPMMLPEPMLPKMSSIQFTFGLMQLITAAIGSVLSYLIWIPLKKVYDQ